MIELAINFVTLLISKLGYPGIFALMFLDALNVPAASEITLLFTGFLSYTGRFEFISALALTFLGNLLGGVLNYHIGRFGQKLFLSEEKVAKGRRFIERHFNYAPFLANILPFLRSFIALPLGLVRYPFRKFLWQAALAYFIWSFVFISFGFSLAERWHLVLRYSRILDFVALGVIIGLIAFVWKHRKIHPKEFQNP